jgi:pSer/pThr/pTyr-binding forkhead associated (FHA) protein
MTKLYIIEGPEKGKSFKLEGDAISLGRAPDNDVQIEDKSVSRKHAMITKKGTAFFIEDLNSKNGTFIGGMQVHPGKTFMLEEGAPIALGNVMVSLGKLPTAGTPFGKETMEISVELSDNEIAVLDSLDIAKEVNEASQEAIEEAMSSFKEAFEKDEPVTHDRPLTPQKNVELLYKVTGVLMNSLNVSNNINDILEKILIYILDLLKRIDRGVFILIDPETGEIAELIPILKGSAGDSLRVYSRTIVNRVIQERKPIIMLDTHQEEEADLSESIELMKVRSVMCVPMISKSRIRGVIYVDSISKPYGFRREDLSLLTALSIPAAYAIENAMMGRDFKGEGG